MPTRLAVLFIPLLGLAAAGCANDFVPYTPMEAIWSADEPEYVPAPEMLTPAHVAAMRAVLESAGEPAEMRDGTLYIQRRLADDHDYLAYLTRQAQDLAGARPCREGRCRDRNALGGIMSTHLALCLAAVLALAAAPALPSSGATARTGSASLPAATPTEAPQKPLAAVTGTVEFKDATKYGPETVVEIEILDVSKADTPAVTMGKQILKDFKTFPIPFEVPYDPAAVKPGHRYSIGVRILISGRLTFVSDTVVPVINEGPTKNVKVPVVRVKQPQV